MLVRDALSAAALWEKDFGLEGDFIQRKHRSSRLENHFKNEPPNEISAAALNGSSWNRCWAAQKTTGACGKKVSLSPWHKTFTIIIIIMKASDWTSCSKTATHWPVQPAHTWVNGAIHSYCTVAIGNYFLLLHDSNGADPDVSLKAASVTWIWSGEQVEVDK